jgi:hypothetical protein
MSAMMGLKVAKRVYSLGTKLHLLHSLGKKLGKLVSDHSSHNIKGSSVGKDLEVNNMIYNKSNLGDTQYLPFGVKKIMGQPTKKSYLEKR